MDSWLSRRGRLLVPESSDHKTTQKTTPARTSTRGRTRKKRGETSIVMGVVLKTRMRKDVVRLDRQNIETGDGGRGQRNDDEANVWSSIAACWVRKFGGLAHLAIELMQGLGMAQRNAVYKQQKATSGKRKCIRRSRRRWCAQRRA